MLLNHAAIHGSYALTAAQEQPGADDRLQGAKKALFDLAFVSCRWSWLTWMFHHDSLSLTVL
jgi:hypothetical protein